MSGGGVSADSDAPPLPSPKDHPPKWKNRLTPTEVWG